MALTPEQSLKVEQLLKRKRELLIQKKFAAPPGLPGVARTEQLVQQRPDPAEEFKKEAQEYLNKTSNMSRG